MGAPRPVYLVGEECIMKVKLTFIEAFESDFQGKNYKIFQFCNPITLDIINGVNLESNVKLIPYDVYICTLERKNNKWRVTDVSKVD